MTQEDILNIVRNYPNKNIAFGKNLPIVSDDTVPIHNQKENGKEKEGVYECENGFGSLYEIGKRTEGKYVAISDVNNLIHLGVLGANEKLTAKANARDEDVVKAIDGYPEGCLVSDEDGHRFISHEPDNTSAVPTAQDFPPTDSPFTQIDDRIANVAIETGELECVNEMKYPVGTGEIGEGIGFGYDGMYLYCTFTAPFDFVGGVVPKTFVYTNTYARGSFGPVAATGGFYLMKTGETNISKAIDLKTEALYNEPTTGTPFSPLFYFKGGVNYSIYVILRNGYVAADGVSSFYNFYYRQWYGVPIECCHNISSTPGDEGRITPFTCDHTKLLYWRYVLGSPGTMIKTGKWDEATMNPYNPKFPHWNSHETA